MPFFPSQFKIVLSLKMSVLKPPILIMILVVGTCKMVSILHIDTKRMAK